MLFRSKDKLKICTVIGFPNGYSTKETKMFECEDALKNGADEIDMVINLVDVKNNNFKAIEEEIKAIKDICKDHILKVIIETCFLSEEEKIKLLSSDGMLIKRPILVTDKGIYVGFKEKEWEKIKDNKGGM